MILVKFTDKDVVFISNTPTDVKILRLWFDEFIKPHTLGECKRIVEENPNSELSPILERLFNEKKIPVDSVFLKAQIVTF